MGLRPNEISALIKEQIKHYDDIIEQKDVGTVVTVGDGVSVIHGLDNAMLGELLLFPNDVYGMVMNLDEDSVGAVLLGSESSFKESLITLLCLGYASMIFFTFPSIILFAKRLVTFRSSCQSSSI